MKETKSHYSFIAISEKKPNTLIVSEGDSDDNAQLVYTTIKGEEGDDPVDLEVLIETFRLISEVVVEAGIVTKWKKRYYAYGYKLLTENKFGIGYDHISPMKFADVMTNVKINGEKAITEGAIEKYKPQKTFDNGWKLSEYENNQLEHDIANLIGGKFIDLYFQLKKEKLEP